MLNQICMHLFPFILFIKIHIPFYNILILLEENV